MIDEYGWVVVSVLVILVGLYSTIMTLKDRNNKPIEDLKENFVNLDKSVVSLIASLNNLNNNYKDNTTKNEAIHSDLVESIKHCNEQLISHEIRITNAEQKITNVEQKIDNMHK